MAIAATASSFAQWRAGLTVGAASNTINVVGHGYDGYSFSHRWGAEIGAAGQYNFKPWLGVRAELSYMRRGYNQRVTDGSGSEAAIVRNDYLIMPVMASFSVGGERLRAFANVGFYGAWWLNYDNGWYYDNYGKHGYYDNGTWRRHDRHNDYDDDCDENRSEAGYVIGIGGEYKCSRHFAAQLECRYYYGATSLTKDHGNNEKGLHNNSIGMKATLLYIF